MRLNLKRYADGELRPHWFGVFQMDGRTRVATLCRWRGTPNPTGRASDTGDAAFEASRADALAELKAIFEGERTAADRTASAERVHRARYGETVARVTLAELVNRWDTLPSKRKGKRSALHVENCKRTLGRFVAFMAEHAPRVKELGAVTGAHVRAFMQAEDARGITGRTWNVTLSLLRRVFRHLDPHAAALRDYLAGEPSREENTVHREPFAPEELKAVFDAAADDDFMRPLVICAASTAMRRGDVCLLRWRSVDLAGGFVTVKTGKTGASVEIPIFPPLRVELEKAMPGARGPSSYVWPDAADMYRHTPDAIDRRLRGILAQAGFVDPRRADGITRAAVRAENLVTLATDDARRRVLAAIDVEPMTEGRRERMRAIVGAYLGGKSLKATAADLGVSPAIVSLRLNEAERLAGVAILRRPTLPARVNGTTLATPEDAGPRLRRGSLRGWHSFRTTWITLALSNGVPIELVRRVTGHAAVDVILKHYFRPGRDDFRRALESAMPTALLSRPTPAPVPTDWRAEIMRIADRITPRNCRSMATELRTLANS